MRQRNEQGGELIVIGNNKVDIHLIDYPHKVDVFFKKKPAPPPCDPRHHYIDQLEWYISRCYRGHGQRYTLTIKWKVHEYREIVWLTYY